MNPNIHLYKRRLANAPDPDETSARDEYQRCLDYIASVMDVVADESDGEDFLDSDPRPLFLWHVTELHGERLELKIPHAEINTFTLRWPDADIQFVEVREPLPTHYYDAHSNPNLNHYTVFIMDFGPYGDAPEPDTPRDSIWSDEDRKNYLIRRLTDPAVGPRYFYGA